LTGSSPNPALRCAGLLLELERLYNYIADLGALANDVGYGVANAYALTIREKLLRHNAEVSGHRLLRQRPVTERTVCNVAANSVAATASGASMTGERSCG
jgi:Ni,Fe-hydrogenase III large subunit